MTFDSVASSKMRLRVFTGRTGRKGLECTYESYRVSCGFPQRGQKRLEAIRRCSGLRPTTAKATDGNRYIPACTPSSAAFTPPGRVTDTQGWIAFGFLLKSSRVRGPVNTSVAIKYITLIIKIEFLLK